MLAHKKLVKFFFILIIPLLCVQLVFIKLYEEPFPSVRFPGFGIIYPSTYPQTYTGLRLALISGEDSAQYNLNELLAPTPQYAKVFFLPMARQLKKLPAHLDSRSAGQKEKELMNYFQRKARENVGFSSLEQMELRWYRFTVEAPNTSPSLQLLEKKIISYD
ncbi:MAG: hypothetical protein ACLFT3_04235 [Cyclobacteriaceae bacterium]